MRAIQEEAEQTRQERAAFKEVSMVNKLESDVLADHVGYDYSRGRQQSTFASCTSSSTTAAQSHAAFGSLWHV